MEKPQLEPTKSMAKDANIPISKVSSNALRESPRESERPQRSRLGGSRPLPSSNPQSTRHPIPEPTAQHKFKSIPSNSGGYLPSSNRYSASTEVEQQILEDAGCTARAKLEGRSQTSRLLMEASSCLFRQIQLEWEDFFHSRTNALWVGTVIMRMGIALICIDNAILLLLDARLFFGHLIPTRVGRDLMVDDRLWSLFDYLPTRHPSTSGVVLDDKTWASLVDADTKWASILLVLWIVQATLLMLGIYPRLHAVCNFVYLVSFQHHDDLLWSSGDTMLRLLCFFLIFMPLHRHTIWDVVLLDDDIEQDPQNTKQKEPEKVETWPMWPFRLVQMQMCLTYWSTFLSKASGSKWQDGTALYYIVQLDDVYGKYFHPAFLFGSLGPLMLLTYATMVLECAAPVFLWWDSTRSATLAFVVAFHLGIDLSMNLGSFHWIMIVGFLAFLAQPMKLDEYDASSNDETVDESEKKRK